MATIKNLFSRGISEKQLSAKSLTTAADEIESADFIKRTLEDKDRVIPQVDFSNPANFARWGSAEDYFEDSINFIQGGYPFDGSLKEKVDWQVSASYLDKWIYDNEYPRTNGLVNMGVNYGAFSAVSGGYADFGLDNYISFRGGPHTGSAPIVGQKFADVFAQSNIYDASNKRENNLSIDGIQGVTSEFWLRKDGFAIGSVESPNQVIFDIHNGQSFGTGGYGRFRVELQSGSAQFHVELASGTSGWSSGSTTIPIGVGLNDLSGNVFNHYALSFINSGSVMIGRLYKNGVLNQQIATGSAINLITGSLLGSIGALRAPVSGVFGTLGSGKLSGSLDEFRFWKTRRTAKQVGKFWFTQVGAGTNSDISNVDLGVYYKFNEGIVSTGTVNKDDQNVLDYSGRASDGYWVGYVTGSRTTDSAMVLAGAAEREFLDPIVNPDHPEVVTLKEEKAEIGLEHDQSNNAAIINSLPGHIFEEDEKKGRRVLRKLAQTMASFFDDVHLQIEAVPQIKSIQYVSSSFKPYPFVNRFLDAAGMTSPEIFSDAEALESLASRDDFREFEEKFFDVRNRIYQNVYNNLVYINKSKGTEKSFRNLIRCFGVGEELIRLNLYSDNTEFLLRDNFRSTITRKKYADFNDVDRFDSTVYQNTASADSNTRSFVTSSIKAAHHGATFEAEILFPKKFKVDSELHFSTPFTVASLYGAHTAFGAETGDTTWLSQDVANFQVQAVRPKLESNDVFFRLTGTDGSNIPTLTSSIFPNVYDNQKWNLAVRLKPTTHPFADGVTGSASSSFDVEFVGYNNILDVTDRSFALSSTISASAGTEFMRRAKRFFVGSHRTNFTGSVRELSDVKISSLRVWNDYLENTAIIAHARDAANFGTVNPHRPAFLTELSNSFGNNALDVPQAQTLALHWTFENVTGSGPSSDGLPTTSDAGYVVQDASSGSVALTDRFKWLGPIVNFQHPGQGAFYLPNSSDVIQREFIHSARQHSPEVLSSDDLVEVRTSDDDLFTRESRPIKHFFAIEKSMYSIVSEEMLKLFATVQDFNNLIGEPVNRYRQNYKAMEKLRQLFFERMDNTVDFNAYVEYFKWIDTSISHMLRQLIPASAQFSEDVRTIVESHVLERNKYWNKFPTLELKRDDLEAGLQGINHLTYPWKEGHAPVGLSEEESKFWWKERAERDASPLATGDSGVDNAKGKFLTATISALNRSFTTPLRINVLTASVEHTPHSATITPVLTIRNIKNSNALRYISSSVKDALGTGSHQPLGTYARDYEIIQMSGRAVNKRHFVKNEGYGTTAQLSTLISGQVDFLIQDFSSSANKFIFANRFSAPGGPETAGRGMLDLVGAEFSPYNNLNFRNTSVRIPLTLLQATHSAQFGLNPANSLQGNFHKTNRNTGYRIKVVGGLPTTASVFDNFFVTHAIPRSDLQYKWITSSVEEGFFGGTVQPFGHQSDFYVPTAGGSSNPPTEIVFLSSSEGISFISASFGRVLGTERKSPGGLQTIPTDFVGMSFHIVDPVSASANTIGQPKLTIFSGSAPDVSGSNYLNPTFLAGILTPGADIFNHLMLHRNGPFNWATWKQIRGGEHPIIRAHKTSSIYSVMDKPQERLFLTSDGQRIVYKDRRSDSVTNFIEPNVSFRYRPLVHFFISKGSTEPVGLQHSYGNNLALFANPELTNRLGAVNCEEQAYDRIIEYYLESDLDPAENPVEGFVRFLYKEVVFPKERNTGLNKIRSRENYTEVDGTGSNGFDRVPNERRSFWRKNLFDRRRIFTSSAGDPPALNSMGRASKRALSIFPLEGNRFQQPSGGLGIPVARRGSNFNDIDIDPRDGAGNQQRAMERQVGELNSAEPRREIFEISHETPPGGFADLPPGAPVPSQQYVHIPNTDYPLATPADQDHEVPPANWVNAISNKETWFDSYDEYADDIRTMAKEYSILPEFKISDHMEYYVNTAGGNFRAQNDRLLTLDGGQITSSAVHPTASGFSEAFFKTYSHSDFQKYFGRFSQDHEGTDNKVSRITLTAKGVKKLLPYNGFYPVTRLYQLGALFSQSVAPFIGGLNYADGQITSGSDSGTLVTGEYLESSSLAIQSMLQPFFAPGIMYNTIKSGIAVDWAAYTGSAETFTTTELAGIPSFFFQITGAANYRIPFEALVDLKSHLPVSSTDGSGKINWISPTNYPLGVAGASAEANGVRKPFFDWSGQKSPLFEMGMNNFLAEAPNFFLKNRGFSTFASKPASTFAGKVVSGNRYYMDVELKKTPDFDMWLSYWDHPKANLYFEFGVFTTTASNGRDFDPRPLADRNPNVLTASTHQRPAFTGRWFGPPVNSFDPQRGFPDVSGPPFGGDSTQNYPFFQQVGFDPGPAPYVPPYLYGASTARISYLADGTETAENTLSKILAGAEIEYINVDMDRLFVSASVFPTGGNLNSPARKTAMNLSSSVNLLGKSSLKRIQYNVFNQADGTNLFAPIAATDPENQAFDVWTISPKFECPTLNFREQSIVGTGSNSDFTAVVTATHGQGAGKAPVGMWSGYGQLPSGSQGIFLSLKDSFNPTDRGPLTGSLIDVCGFEVADKRIGDIAEHTVISECIVAIPFMDTPIDNDDFAKTTKVMGRNFFEIDKTSFDSQKTQKEKGEAAVLNNTLFGDIGQDINTTSISEMIRKMRKYVVPPELDFLTFDDIKPFVMYMFEFDHTLNQEDLRNIWQGLMPRISETAEKGMDTVSHPMEAWEFFGGKKLTENMRWMVFKIKQRARINYFDVTADSQDDDRFKFDFQVGSKTPEFSYNYPHDFYSLVELAQMEVTTEITPLPEEERTATAVTSIEPNPKTNPFGRGGALSGPRAEERETTFRGGLRRA